MQDGSYAKAISEGTIVGDALTSIPVEVYEEGGLWGGGQAWGRVEVGVGIYGGGYIWGYAEACLKKESLWEMLRPVYVWNSMRRG